MRISDWSSDVCSSDLRPLRLGDRVNQCPQSVLIDNQFQRVAAQKARHPFRRAGVAEVPAAHRLLGDMDRRVAGGAECVSHAIGVMRGAMEGQQDVSHRSEEHTSELQSLMRISYAVFCL